MADGSFHPLPFQAEAERIVAQQQARRDRFTPAGVCWSAMAPEYPVVEDVETVRARLVEEDAKHRAFLTTPRGRFLTALQNIEATAGYPEEACKLWSLWRSSLVDDRRLNTAVVGAAVAVLNGIDMRDAREAIDALAELLVSEPMARAA